MASPAPLPGKIALEEHYTSPWLSPSRGEVPFFDPDVFNALEPKLHDLNQTRLQAMDEAGVAIAVLSQTAPGVEAEQDAQLATELARRSNTFLHERIKLHPERFRGFACLALQDVAAACEELRRCIGELGFVGVLVNGSIQGAYLDAPQFEPFWRTLEQLEVPLYLHPGLSAAPNLALIGRPELAGPVWAWTVDTASHALRLVTGGVFDRHPGCRIIVGHMGETLPFQLWRFDSRSAICVSGRRLSRPPSETIREHVYVTTSGVCDDSALRCAIETMGEDRVMFSIDYPYEDHALAGRWIDAADLPEVQKRKVTRDTAARLLRLPLS